MIGAKSFPGGKLSTTPTPELTHIVKAAEVRLQFPVLDLDDETCSGEQTFYFGPNDCAVMDKVAEGFSKNVTLGWPVFRWVNRWTVMPVFSFLEQYSSNYGILIVFLVLLMKILLFPLSYSSYVSMAKVRVIKPTLDAIQKKHGDNTKATQEEQMKFYREMGINPLGGCIPLLLQMPILVAMFNFFPNAIALRQQPFLWVSDLSTYDAVLQLPFSLPLYGSHVSLFTLLMGISTFLYTRSNNTEGPMQTASYVMPFTAMLVLNNLPAGLNWYYCVSNLVTLGQQTLIRRMVDEDKLKEKLEQYRLKNKSTKSRIQDRFMWSKRGKEKE